MGFQLKSGNRPSLKGGVVEPSRETMDISIAVVDATPMKEYNHKKEVRKANREYDKNIKDFEKSIKKNNIENSKLSYNSVGDSAFAKSSAFK